jgi:HAD superfamily hydrolase (TIGR01509 family)
MLAPCRRLPRCYCYDTVWWCLSGVVLVDAHDELARDPRGAVLFDFGGTLDADGLRWSVRFHAAYARLGGRLDLEAFEPVFRASDRQLEQHPDIRHLGFRAMIEAQASILRSLVPDAPAMDLSAVADQVHGDAVRVAMRNRTLLGALRDRYRLAVVSNFTGNLEVCLGELGLRDLFEVVTDSAVLGSSKPDPRPFTETLALMRIPVGRAWVVGDNVQADIRPAQRLGIQTIWLAPPDRSMPHDCVPSARISSLKDLAAALHAAGASDAAPLAPCTA